MLSLPLGDRVVLSIQERGGGAFTKENSYSAFMQKEEGREFFQCLLFLNCLQLKKILRAQVSYFGVSYSDPHS